MTELVNAFRHAERALTIAQGATGAESYLVDPIELQARLQLAAHVLLDDAAERHPHIEELSKLYLLLGADGQWKLDTVVDDGNPLDGYDQGPANSECEHDNDEDNEECNAVRDAAAYRDLPDARKLRELLNDYLDEV